MFKDSTTTILHITPHLGGGVGKVLLNYLSKSKENSDVSHRVVCLDYANDNAVRVAKNIGLPLYDNMFQRISKLLDLISDADIVLVHWWNHPLLYDFLIRHKLPPCRLVVWSHISGFHPPYVFTEKILLYPDIFVFTTPISFEVREVKKLSDKQKKSLQVVWSTGGVEQVRSVKSKKHSGFNVGYIGTVDYAKLHPRFLNICSKINIPGVKFIVCGGANEKEIQKAAEDLGIAEKFNFTGPVPSVTKYLSLFDIFGYPLNSHHYGTCDQALAESMAAGVVPVVLKNRMEKYMVADGMTGIVAKNIGAYIRAIRTLYEDRILRDSLSQRAKEYAQKTFSVIKMAEEWGAVFEKALTVPKTSKKWGIVKKIGGLSAKDIFLESLGHYGKNFILDCKAKGNEQKKIAAQKIKKMAKEANWQSQTKGSAHQYFSFFPDDKHLSRWSALMKNAD